MFVYSLKASTLKFFGVLFLSLCAVVALIVFIPQYEPASAYVADETVSYTKIKTNDDRVALLSQFGYEVEAEAVDEAEITIPAEFDTVLESYNTLQQKQGLDLQKYRRKTVTRYTYKVTNYAGYDGTVLANVIVYKNKVIGGDVCSADVNGFIHGFSKEVTLP